ncbi:ABC transporter substrate-binding protein [Halorarius litoreus]|uniref:ABC transporter substrate-binding protein n=1 Tax=Halorarius litoreus TaxID=2962676 RepID=UPI0020CFDFCC|nr:ABC transporter substrate-binding protein [Halorarius litoreus]
MSFAGCTGDGGDGGDGGGGGGNGGGGGGGGDGGDGGGTTGEPQIEGPVKLGLLAPLPESIALGRAYANAGKIVTKRLNDAGGLLGAEVELVIKDSELNASKTQQAYRELVLQEEVDATFGLLSTEPLNQILGDIASQQKIHITSGTGNTGLNDEIRNNYENRKYVFRSHQNGYIQGYNLTNYFDEYADDIGVSDIAIMLEDIEGYKPHAQAIREHLPDGMSIQMDEIFSPGTEDYRPLLRQAERANVDMAVVFVSVTGPTLINQWASMQPNFALGGFSIAASDPKFYENNPSAEYMMTGVPGAVANYTPTELTSTFIQEHKDMFDGAVPPYYTAYTTHDAIWSWAKAVEEAGTLNEDDVIATLEDGSWEGVQGQMDYYKGDETFADTDFKFAHDLRFGEDGVQPPNYQWQVQDGEGEQVVLWPESARQGEFQWPDWIDR